MRLRNYAVEFIGTFFLVLTIGCAILNGANSPLTPLAIGSALAVMIFAGGHVSGGHFNPAVSLAVLIRGKLPVIDLLPYWAAQFAGAIVAVFATRAITGTSGSGAALTASTGAIFLAEFLFTFALAWVVLNVATAKANAGNSFYGLAIGFTVLVGAVAVGSISGGAFNPAVAVGAGLLKLVPISSIWIHFLADFAGAAVAAVAFKALVAKPD